MFSFFSTFKTDVKNAISGLHDKVVNLETKVEALFHHAATQAAAVPAAVEAAPSEVAAAVENEVKVVEAAPAAAVAAVEAVPAEVVSEVKNAS